MLALTGTPGVGKTTVGNLLRQEGYDVLDLNTFIRRSNLRGRKDEARDSYDVDIEALKGRFRGEPEYDIVEGHLSHHLSLSTAVVLRCDPRELKSRIEKAKDWAESKKEENIKAEMMDVILTESMDLCDEVFEIDTTSLTPRETKEAVLDILDGKTDTYLPGDVDWSEQLWDLEGE